jgi:hypothetical protein
LGCSRDSRPLKEALADGGTVKRSSGEERRGVEWGKQGEKDAGKRRKATRVLLRCLSLGADKGGEHEGDDAEKPR